VTGRIFQALPTQTDTIALIYKMAKGAGARQSTKYSSFGSGAASQGELQQHEPNDGGVLPAVVRALLGT
jgi:hypothetical protein